MKEKKQYSVSVIRDTRSKKGDDAEAPLKLLANISGDRFRVGIDLYATAADFNSAMKVKGGTEETKQLRKKLADLIQKAEEVLDSMQAPNKEGFIRFFKSDVGISNTKCDVTPVFQEKMKELTANGSIKYALMMRLTLSSLKSYRDPISFNDVDEKWLRGYEAKMVADGRSMTTIQMYAKNFRTIWNKAIKENLVPAKNYPFKDYQIGASVRSADVLFPEDIERIWKFEGRTMRDRRSLAYWKFSYLSAMNFKDLCYLKIKNIQTDILSFIREKTKATNRVKGAQVKVAIHPEMQKVIDEYGNKSVDPEAYIFPILNGRLGAVDCEARRDKFQRQVNDHLKEIGNELGLKVQLRLGIARHSFATTLMMNGTPIAFIGQMLGHQNIKTTMNYIHTLPSEKYKEASNTLVPFLNDK